MIIYVVISDPYSTVYAVFTTKENAEAFAEKYNSSPRFDKAKIEVHEADKYLTNKTNYSKDKIIQKNMSNSQEYFCPHCNKPIAKQPTMEEDFDLELKELKAHIRMASTTVACESIFGFVKKFDFKHGNNDLEKAVIVKFSKA